MTASRERLAACDGRHCVPFALSRTSVHVRQNHEQWSATCPRGSGSSGHGSDGGAAEADSGGSRRGKLLCTVVHLGVGGLALSEPLPTFWKLAPPPLALRYPALTCLLTHNFLFTLISFLLILLHAFLFLLLFLPHLLLPILLHALLFLLLFLPHPLLPILLFPLALLLLLILLHALLFLLLFLPHPPPPYSPVPSCSFAAPHSPPRSPVRPSSVPSTPPPPYSPVPSCSPAPPLSPPCSFAPSSSIPPSPPAPSPLVPLIVAPSELPCVPDAGLSLSPVIQDSGSTVEGTSEDLAVGETNEAPSSSSSSSSTPGRAIGQFSYSGTGDTCHLPLKLLSGRGGWTAVSCALEGTHGCLLF
ncbi:uncharacterized protein LOC114845410 [Betta splendens]|uniref:Uncharacterized protein LOC114845410 n=1 Tax=Betta splendens TaxID=158456 RepID=A0A9W2XG04_BETSP|nr:uncharacterized protein LOC114845410 [Betta splendens]